MKALVLKISDNTYSRIVEINTLDDLRALEYEYRNELIVEFDIDLNVFSDYELEETPNLEMIECIVWVHDDYMY